MESELSISTFKWYYVLVDRVTDLVQHQQVGSLERMRSQGLRTNCRNSRLLSQFQSVMRCNLIL